MPLTYNVYKNDTLVQSGVTGTTATVTGLTASTSYAFAVSAVNNGVEGPKSTVLNQSTTA